MRGYVIILVEGYFLERFINICTRRQIYLWGINKINNATMELRISIKGFKALRPIVRKTRCRVKILDKRGLPFVLYRHRRRKTFALGIALFLGLLWYMTSFIWVIEITGNEKIPKDEILGCLDESGLKVGTLKMRLNLSAIENEMLLRNDQLSWIGIDVKGTKAMVEVKERRKPPKIVEKHIPCNIVGGKDAVIKSMVVKSGRPVVKEGDTVKKGQLLVSGVIDSKVAGIRYVHAVASIKARTWYEKSKEVSLIRDKKVKTGNSVTNHSLKIFDFRINFFINSSIPYANYDKITDRKALTIGREYVLPIVFESNQYEEVLVEKEKLELDWAISEAAEQLREELQKELKEDTEILDEKIEHIFIDENNLLLKLTVECIEEIGLQEPIIK